MKIPTATYRLQFHKGFSFQSAVQILPYLKELGISHIYASPILKARKGSLHGYDLVDPKEINPELGGEKQFEQLLEEVHTWQLGWIQDIVANHMAYDHQNPYLMDVLENGEFSSYSDYFEIEWKNPYEHLQGRVLAPFLAEFYGTCLDKGMIQLVYKQEGFFLQYYDLLFPICREAYSNLLKLDLSALAQRVGQESEGYRRFLSLVEQIEQLDPSKVAKEEIVSRFQHVKTSLHKLVCEDSQVASYIDSLLVRLNGQRDQPATFNELDELQVRQNYRLSYWKVSNEELNYRRFFTINDLVSIKMQKKEVFDFVHEKLFDLIRSQKIDGLRIDHLDGLYNPTEYIDRLREYFPDLYIVAEKILDLFEVFPHDMKLQGTTGYDFLNYVNGLFVDKKNERKLSSIYVHFCGPIPPYKELVLQNKHLFLARCLAGDVYNLAHLLKKILGISRYGRDMTIYGLKRGLFEVLAHFPIYRTYVYRNHLTKRDEGYIKQVVAEAKNSYPSLQYELTLIERILLLYYGVETPELERQAWAHFSARFQQLSSSLMAKGIEDTVLYQYNRLLSLNEVGSNPSLFGISIKDFHDCNEFRARNWPYSMNSTATHDTKRGEDVRARLNVLSEMPKEWGSFVKECSRTNRKQKQMIGLGLAPDSNEEYLLYQTMLGAYPFKKEEIPFFEERIKKYMVKVLREAKVHSSWNNPDVVYEQACLAFIESIFDEARSHHFWNLFLPFQKKIAFYGLLNSLSETLLKLSSPGLPDVYQGTELWDLSLVDPDNRREVDFTRRIRFLQEMKEKEEHMISLIQEIFAHKEDGRVKLFEIYRALNARRESYDLFEKGDYFPLQTRGKYENNIVAFMRKSHQSYCLVIIPRFLSYVVPEGRWPLGATVWQDTSLLLPPDVPISWSNALTNEMVRMKGSVLVGDLLALFPTALLFGG